MINKKHTVNSKNENFASILSLPFKGDPIVEEKEEEDEEDDDEDDDEDEDVISLDPVEVEVVAEIIA